MGHLPLEDVKILDFMWVLAGPGITRMLADYGGTVVRIEWTRCPDRYVLSDLFRTITQPPKIPGFGATTMPASTGLLWIYLNPELAASCLTSCDGPM